MKTIMSGSQNKPRLQCLSCGALLPEGENYKCDVCQQIELELIDEDDVPFGYMN